MKKQTCFKALLMIGLVMFCVIFTGCSQQNSDEPADNSVQTPSSEDSSLMTDSNQEPLFQAPAEGSPESANILYLPFETYEPDNFFAAHIKGPGAYWKEYDVYVFDVMIEDRTSRGQASTIDLQMAVLPDPGNDYGYSYVLCDIKGPEESYSILLDDAMNPVGYIPSVWTVEKVETPDTLSALFHIPYLNASSIEVNNENKREKLIENMKTALNKEAVFVDLERGGLLGFLKADYYAVSRYSGQYWYYGSVKDNRPDGFGILSVDKIDVNDESTLTGLIYAGDFDKGICDGYGAEFFESTNPIETNYSYGASVLVNEFKLHESFADLVTIYLNSYVVYDGNFKNGKRDNKGNIFELYYDRGEPVDGYWAGSCYPSIMVTEMKKDRPNGDAKVYEFGVLTYDGEMKNGNRHGKGTLFYENGQKRYKGEFKRGRYHGKGTLYDSDGSVQYKGKWENGDYAS